MSDREDNVCKAKLAEQAERYDGKKTFQFLIMYFLGFAIEIIFVEV